MKMGQRPQSTRESGQAAVESALVMPMMVFIVLGIIQLTMIQHARIMTEYAAFNAARAGIVWNGNNERMHDAAIMSLLPTMGRSDNFLEMGQTWLKHQAYDLALRQLSWGAPVPDSLNGSNLLGFIRVDTINPAAYTPVDSIWKLPPIQGNTGINWKELDFDGPDSYPETPDFAQRIIKFFNLPQPDPQEEAYRKATVLSIRLRYWYEMRIPFANWMVFMTWYATTADVSLMGGIGREDVNMNPMGASESIAGGSSNRGLMVGMTRGLPNQKGFNTAYPPEMWVLYGLATGSIPLLSNAVGKRYFIPLSATYSMRMQSNFHKKWIMHLNPDWGL